MNNLGMLYEVRELREYRADELALQMRVLAQLQKYLEGDLAPSAAYEFTKRLQEAESIITLYNICMNNYVKYFMREQQS